MFTQIEEITEAHRDASIIVANVFSLFFLCNSMKIENYYLKLAIGKNLTCDVTFRSSSFSFYAVMKVAATINSFSHKQHRKPRSTSAEWRNKSKKKIVESFLNFLNQPITFCWSNASCYQASVWLTFQFPFQWITSRSR